MAASGSFSTVVIVHSSSSQPAPVPMISTIIAVASAVSSGQQSLAVVGSSYVLQLLFYGDNVSKDLQGPLDLIREQHEAASRLATSRLSDLEIICDDLAVASATISGPSSTVSHLCTWYFQLRAEVSRLTSGVGPFQALRDELDLSRRHLADRDAEVDRLRAVFTLVRELLDGGFAGPGDHS